MSIAGYIVLGIVILFLLLFYIVIGLSYLICSKAYRNAIRTEAVILEDLGDIKLATGSYTIGIPRFRMFHKYKVSYFVNEEKRIEEVDLRQQSRQIGDHVEVRYNISSRDKIQLESEAYVCWLREMAIGYTIGIIIGIILSIFKVKG